jgi:hypothetical protein
MTAHYLGTDTSLQNGWVALVLRVQASSLSEIMQPCKCSAHVSKMSTFTYNGPNSVIIMNAIILNVCDTEVVIYIILVLLKRADGNCNVGINFKTHKTVTSLQNLFVKASICLFYSLIFCMWKELMIYYAFVLP